jgi:hypothetical protein
MVRSKRASVQPQQTAPIGIALSGVLQAEGVVAYRHPECVWSNRNNKFGDHFGRPDSANFRVFAARLQRHFLLDLRIHMERFS